MVRPARAERARFLYFINHHLQLVADLLEKRAPFNGMRGKRGEEIAVQQPDQVNILAAADADDGGGGGGAHVHVVQRG